MNASLDALVRSGTAEEFAIEDCRALAHVDAYNGRRRDGAEHEKRGD